MCYATYQYVCSMVLFVILLADSAIGAKSRSSRSSRTPASWTRRRHGVPRYITPTGSTRVCLSHFPLRRISAGRNAVSTTVVLYLFLALIINPRGVGLFIIIVLTLRACPHCESICLSAPSGSFLQVLQVKPSFSRDRDAAGLVQILLGLVVSRSSFSLCSCTCSSLTSHRNRSSHLLWLLTMVSSVHIRHPLYHIPVVYLPYPQSVLLYTVIAAFCAIVLINLCFVPMLHIDHVQHLFSATTGLNR